MHRASWMAALSVLGLIAAAPSSSKAGCLIGPAATFELDPVAGHLRVPAQLDGQAATLLLDTGAARTVMDPDAVARFGLPLSEWAAMTLRGAGGDVRHRVAIIRSLAIGGTSLHRRSATGDMSVGVAPLGAMSGGSEPVAGLLGGDFLWGYDLEIDAPARSGALHRVQGCTGAFIPWTKPFDTLPAFRPNLDWLIIPVTVDGHQLNALIDTGAPASIITPRGAGVLGLTQERMIHDPVQSIGSVGPNQVEMRQHRFAEVRIGSQTLHDVPLLVGPVQLLHMLDLVLGNDWLRYQHVWLSYTSTQVFIDRTGPSAGFGAP